jgi:Mg2+/Co2+ transporter CorB
MFAQNWPLSLLVLGVLILLSGFFSGSETAMMAVNRLRLRHLAKGDSRAETAQRILEEPEKLIGTLLLCNNLVNVALSALGTALAIAFLGEEGVLYATFAITLVLLIFAEITPKTIAAYHADWIAVVISPVLRVSISSLYPVVRLLSFISHRLIVLLHLQKREKGEQLTGEEIQSLIEVSGEHGTLESDQQSMLLGVLRLDATMVRDVMVPMADVTSLQEDAELDHVLEVVRRTEFSRYPVYRERPSEIVGFVHVRDLIGFTPESPFSLRKILRKPYFVPEIRSIRQQLTDFQAQRAHLSFVVDEYGGVVGLVTLEDVLEEIVGDIEDEHDRFKNLVQKLQDGSYLVKGWILLRDLNRWMGLGLPEGEVRTVAGLVVKAFGTLPQPRDQVTVDGYTFRIIEMKGKRIRTLRLWLPPEQLEPEKGEGISEGGNT